MNRVFTIGASTMPIERLLELLRVHSITAVADVRSIPASRFMPQFNKKPLRDSLRTSGVRYVFLGDELGARSAREECYVDDVVQYERLAQTPEFEAGIERVLDGASRERIALLCTEHDPLDCHRAILVSRVLAERDTEIHHIHTNGQLESHGDAMLRLRRKFHLDQPSLLDDEDDQLSEALRRQEQQIAYVRSEAATVS
ncbi:DUF488 family protein [Microbacterium sp. NPDC058062]|uniref:DUF488 domain-containing protein n=1 Tax=Microbacterium sp. NPDC058062 TaxID=3346320 RepID=UPI0036D94082